MRRLVVISAVLFLSLALAVPVYAHAKFVSSTPTPGQTVATSPASVNITFSEELGTGTTGSVTDASGNTVSTGATIDANDRTKMSITLKPSLPNGVFKVAWHSVAEDDGGILDGTFFFGVGVPAPSTSTAPATNIPLAIAGFAFLAISSVLLFARRTSA